MKIARRAVSVLALMCPVLVVWSASCGAPGSASTQSGGTSSGGSGGAGGSTGPFGTGTFSGGTAGGGPCMGLECQVHACSGGGATTVSGTIYDPAGKNPLYGVVAYVPNTKVEPFTPGASCYACKDLYSGAPVASAVTDAQGHFTIKNAPDGPTIPLVIQVGKWRRQFVLPKVAMCADTPVPDKTLTLPKNSGEGDIPNIAISTGSADTLECLLSRVGVDKAEYTGGPGGPQRLHIFHGQGGPDTNPGAPEASQALWNSAANIMQFDMVILSCEGDETANMDQQVLFDYAAKGGRVFASHFHYAWFNTGPFATFNLAQWSPGSNQFADGMNDVVTKDWAGMPFLRGQALFDWLQNVNALTSGQLPIQQPRHNADVTAAHTLSQPWIVAAQNAQVPGATQDFTFDTPLNVPPEQRCGRVAFSDMHVGAASGDYNGGGSTPGGCADQDLSPQEKALEFILFDLSSCVTPNNVPIDPPH